MKHVNGDMEDLFRRAAEKYPLRTDSADWDRLSAALDKDPGPPSDADEDEKRRRRGIFWWWLLLPLAGALGFYGWRATVRPSTHLSKVPAAIEAPATGTAGAPATGTAGAPATGTTSAPATTSAGGAVATTGRAGTQGGGTTGGGTTGGASAQAGGVSSGDVTGTIGGRTIGGRTTGAGTTGLRGERGGATASAAKAGHKAHTDGGNMTSDANNDSFDAAKIGGSGTGNSGSGTGGGTSNSGGVTAGGIGADAGNGVEGRGGVEGRSKIDSRRASTAGSFNLMVDVKAPAARKDSSAPTKKATAKSSHGHGYIGLTGAPDLSTVKMQATKGVGTTWGLLLGYSFNDHWAVESGVSLDRKKYYTAGEYFDKEGDPALLPYTVNSVNGTCNMWEIPLNVRYNFNPGAKITWFATTGLSTYLMTKQQYSYSLETNGGYPWNQNWSTAVPSNYLFSIINISGGFERRIGQIGNLRIEPYLRIPLSGIGSGKLPIMSAGINIGITRRLW